MHSTHILIIALLFTFCSMSEAYRHICSYSNKNGEGVFKYNGNEVTKEEYCSIPACYNALICEVDDSKPPSNGPSPPSHGNDRPRGNDKPKGNNKPGADDESEDDSSSSTAAINTFSSLKTVGMMIVLINVGIMNL